MHGALRTIIHTVLTEKKATVSISPGLHPWPNQVKKIPFRAASKAGVGPGEERLAAMWNGETFGQGVSMDVQASDGTRWEVKMPDGKNCSGEVRVEQEGIRALEHPMNVIKTVVKKLVTIFDPEHPANNDLVSSVFEAGQLSVIREYFYGRGGLNVASIMRGEIGSGRLVGLRDVLNRVSATLNREQYKQRRRHSTSRMTAVVQNAEGQSETIDLTKHLDIETLITIVKKYAKGVKVNPKQSKGSAMKSRFSFTDEELLHHKFFAGNKSIFNLAFANPDEFIARYWTNAVKASDVFKDVDGVVLVSEDYYRVVPRAELDSVFFMNRVSKGKPYLSARKVEGIQDIGA